MAGIKSLFSAKQLENAFDQFQEKIHDDILQTFQFVGEHFVNNARLSGNYTDRTGNLRSSIGYVILLNGEVIDSNSGRFVLSKPDHIRWHIVEPFEQLRKHCVYGFK